MLTGMLAPSGGYATVGGKDIRTEMNDVREEIGICLQHDCLFPQLTVTEHIEFFARVKGLYAKLPLGEAKEKVETNIRDVALWEKRNTLSKNLSGGMKRKLSVAIAFCGESKTVLLDEPTSGMVSVVLLTAYAYCLLQVCLLCLSCAGSFFQKVHLERDSSISTRPMYHSDYAFYGRG